MLIEPKHHIVNAGRFPIQLTLQIIREAFNIAFVHHFLSTYLIFFSMWNSQFPMCTETS